MKNPDVIKLRDKHQSKFWRIIFGYTCILVGFSGVILPVLPGWPFVFLGIFILGGEEGLRKTFSKYFPKPVGDKILNYMDKIYGKSKK